LSIQIQDFSLRQRYEQPAATRAPGLAVQVRVNPLLFKKISSNQISEFM